MRSRNQLGYKKVRIAGHDIGLMVAYAYAAQYPAEVDRIVLMDAFLPGVGDTTNICLLRDLWHFHFYGETPLKLVRAASESISSISGTISPPIAPNPCLRRIAAFTRRPTPSRAPCAPDFEVFRAFDQDAKDFAGFAKTKLTMPMLVLSGEKAGGQFLIDQGKMVDDNVEGVIVTGSGHWLVDEAPGQVIPKLVAFLAH